MAELQDKLRPEASEPAEPASDQAAAPHDDRSDQGGGGGLSDSAAESGPMHPDSGNFGLKDDFSIWESQLATRLGLSQRDVAGLRSQHLQEGIDFVKNGRRLLYCEAGVAKLARVLTNGSHAEKSLPTGVLCAEQAVAEVLKPEKFRVRRKAMNTHVLECVDSAGKIVVVRVRDSANFLPGMEVSAVPYGNLPNVFEFSGAYPRFRGKY